MKKFEKPLETEFTPEPKKFPAAWMMTAKEMAEFASALGQMPDKDIGEGTESGEIIDRLSTEASIKMGKHFQEEPEDIEAEPADKGK